MRKAYHVKRAAVGDNPFRLRDETRDWLEATCKKAGLKKSDAVRIGSRKDTRLYELDLDTEGRHFEFGVALTEDELYVHLTTRAEDGKRRWIIPAPSGEFVE